jgi:RNA polymerase subunit RPABC4/transcription elongation factor Spt4
MSPEVMLTIIKIAAVFVAVSFVVFWVGLVWWVSQDALTRTKDKIIISAAVGLTAILGPVGTLIYLVVRPRQTLKERLGEMMEQEMMLQASAITICPTCERMAQDDFLACPHCGTVLKKPCVGCGKLLAMDWDHCPFCGLSQQPPVAIAAAEVVIDQAQADQSQLSQDIEIVVTEAAAPADASLPKLDKNASQSRPIMDVLRNLFAPVNRTESLAEDQPDTAPQSSSVGQPVAAKKHKPSARKPAAKKGKSSAKKR